MSWSKLLDKSFKEDTEEDKKQKKLGDYNGT